MKTKTDEERKREFQLQVDRMRVYNGLPPLRRKKKPEKEVLCRSCGKAFPSLKKVREHQKEDQCAVKRNQDKALKDLRKHDNGG